MKNRNLDHKDDWMTPPYFYKELDEEFNFNFDPCPFHHNPERWDGLKVEWLERNYINPPYSRKLKEAFVNKAVEESRRGKLCVILLPVSTSTRLFHSVIKPNATEIRFIKGRVPFIGINARGEFVNYHLLGKEVEGGVKNSGQHDSMVVIFDGR